MPTTTDSAINALVDEATSTTTLDWFVLDKWDGSQYVTSKIKPENVGGKNFANANLTLTANRSHDGDSNRMTMAKFKDFTFETFIAPTVGLASLNFNGYGSSVSDLTHEFNSDGGVTMRMYGDNSSRYYGNVQMNANTQIQFQDANQYIRKSTDSNGTEFVNNGGSIKFGFNNGQVFMQGNFDYDSIQCINSQTTSYFTQQNGNYAYRFGKNGNNGSIRGTIGGGFTNTEIVSLEQTDGAFNLLLGLLKITGIPTSSAGLASGTVWSDSGTLKIV
jgi:hypothetical protein